MRNTTPTVAPSPSRATWQANERSRLIASANFSASVHDAKFAMDRVTQLEEAYDTLLRIMAAAIAYLSRKAPHMQVNPTVPLTLLGNTEAIAPEDLASSRTELVEDLVLQAKEVSWRIDQLPKADEAGESVSDTASPVVRCADAAPATGNILNAHPNNDLLHYPV